MKNGYLSQTANLLVNLKSNTMKNTRCKGKHFLDTSKAFAQEISAYNMV